MVVFLIGLFGDLNHKKLKIGFELQIKKRKVGKEGEVRGWENKIKRGG